MKRLALAGFTLTATAVAAAPVWAADLPQTNAPSYEPVPAAQQTVNWTGLYVGGDLGWAFANFDNRSNPTGSFDSYANGVIGGLYAGYNYQVTPNVVVGAEADFSLSDLDKTKSVNGFGVRTKSSWNSNIRGRVGYSFDQFLVYGAGGLALADLQAQANGDKDTKTVLGWTAGVGVEGMVTNNVTARLEYVYQDFGDKDFNLGGTAVTTGMSDSLVRLGVGYKF